MIVNDPSLVMLAFRQAHRRARTPRARRAVSRAYNTWAEGLQGPASGSVASTAAMACANEYGVEGLFLAGVADVAAAVATTAVEDDTGRELDQAEQAFVETAAQQATARATDSDASWSAWVQSLVGKASTEAYNAAVTAATAVRDAALAAQQQALDAAKDAAVEVTELVTAPARDLGAASKTAATTGTIVAVGLLALGGLWLWNQQNRKG